MLAAGSSVLRLVSMHEYFNPEMPSNGGSRMANQLDFTVGGLLAHIAGLFPERDALVYVERGLHTELPCLQ
jgi:hypothetical protein